MPTQIDPNKLAELQMDKCEPEIIPELCLLGFEAIVDGENSVRYVRYMSSKTITLYDDTQHRRNPTGSYWLHELLHPYISEVDGSWHGNLNWKLTPSELVEIVSHVLEENRLLYSRPLTSSIPDWLRPYFDANRTSD